MKSLVVVCTILAVSQALSFSEVVKQEWNTYKVQHRKSYLSPTEEATRMSIFMENRMKIAKHNERFLKGEVSYDLQLNEFGDMTHEEFVSKMTGAHRSLFKDQLKEYRQGALMFNATATTQAPESVDWRQKGVVSPVKNQGTCGGCWAFGATGAIEGQYWMKGNKVLLSEQNLIDCASDYGNYGCLGGFRNYAFKYIIANHGVDTEDSYPYEAKDGSCRFKSQNVGATMSNYVVIPERDEAALKQALATIGPIGVAMDAGGNDFHLYKSGVYYTSTCSTNYYRLNHEVLAVGYGSEDGNDYWLVKNSWGTTWGEEGYFKISMKKNDCGISTDPSYPVL